MEILNLTGTANAGSVPGATSAPVCVRVRPVAAALPTTAAPPSRTV